MKRWVVAVAVAVVWGLGAGWWVPRGPLTAVQALWSVGISLAVGGLAGFLSRSRWSMLVAPACFVVALELARWGVQGPSVDAVHLSLFGFIALVTGRGMHGLLSVLPMVVGAAYGAGIARKGTTGRPVWRYVRRAGVGLLAALVLLVTVAAAVPARTAPVTGPDGRPLARGVAELTSVDAGGHRLGLMIRGDDTRAPVLLFVPGAPGGSELGAVRRHLTALERRFVVVTLDRRGAGRSYPALDPTSTVTLASAVDDIVAVTDHLRHRFRQDRIYLLGHSGGSMLSVLAVQRHPELFRAYIGTGQAVDLPASDRIFYADILAWARSTGKHGLVKQLTDLGPPPYRDLYSYEPIMTYENTVYGNAYNPVADVDVSEYTLLEKVHTMNAIFDTWPALYPHMQGVDLRTQVLRLEVPVYFVQGAQEMRGLADLFTPWYDALQAPAKHLDVLDPAGHRAIFEQPDRFAAIMARVLTET